MCAVRLHYSVVPVGTAVLNDSIPDARVGQEVLKEAQVMLAAGMSGKEVLASLRAKWGATEVIQAIAMAVGQDNFRRAVLAGRLYGNPIEA